MGLFVTLFKSANILFRFKQTCQLFKALIHVYFALVWYIAFVVHNVSTIVIIEQWLMIDVILMHSFIIHLCANMQRNKQKKKQTNISKYVNCKMLIRKHNFIKYWSRNTCWLIFKHDVGKLFTINCIFLECCYWIKNICNNNNNNPK